MARVSFYLPDGAEKTFKLFPDRTLHVGRDPGNDAVLRDAKVSRRHAELSFEKGFFVIRDLGSSNGTFVNGRRIRVAPLTDGAELRLGGTLAKFSEELARAQSTVPEPRAVVDDPGPTGTEGVRPVIDFPVHRGTKPGGIPSAPSPPPPPPISREPEARDYRNDDYDDDVFETKPHRQADFFSDDLYKEEKPAPPVSSFGGRTVERDVAVDEPTPERPLRRPALSFEPSSDGDDGDKEGDPSRFMIETRGPELAVVSDSNQKAILFFRPESSLSTWLSGLVILIMLVAGAGTTVYLAATSNPIVAIIILLLTTAFVAATTLFLPRRDIELFDDEAMASRALLILQESASPFPWLRYSARTQDGDAIAYFQKSFFTNMGRRRWWIVDAHGHPLGVSYEAPFRHALIRKLAGGLTNRFTTDFLIEFGGSIAGRIRRHAVDFYRSLLEMSKNRPIELDTRTALALAVIIETVERR